MTAADVTLAVLDSRFRVTAGDHRMVDLVRELWEPFVTAPSRGATSVAVTGGRGSWGLDAEGDAPALASDPWVLAAVLRNSLTRRAVAEVTSTVPLHGAAVERDGVHLVLAAPPRAGKTTLLLELIDRGWRLLTDDLVPVDPATLRAEPFLKPLSIREPDRWRRFSAGWGVPEWLPEPRTVGLVPATAFPLAAARPFRPDVLVFPGFSPGAEALAEALTPARTAAACAANLHPAAPTRPEALAAVAALGRSAPGYGLRYPDMEKALELLEKCLAARKSME